MYSMIPKLTSAKLTICKRVGWRKEPNHPALKEDSQGLTLALEHGQGHQTPLCLSHDGCSGFCGHHPDLPFRMEALLPTAAADNSQPSLSSGTALLRRDHIPQGHTPGQSTSNGWWEDVKAVIPEPQTGILKGHPSSRTSHGIC